MMTFRKSASRIAAGALVLCFWSAEAQLNAAGTDDGANPANQSSDGPAVFNPSDSSYRPIEPNATTNEQQRDRDSAGVRADEAADRATTLPEPLGEPDVNHDRDVPALPATDPAEVAALTFSDLDTDGNGEFTAAERAEQRVFLEAKFKAMDTNHNGSVDQFEFEDFQHRKEAELEDAELED